MASSMNYQTFCAKCVEIAQDYKTVYGKGMCGTPIDKANFLQMKALYPDWYGSHAENFEGLFGEGYFGFDCVCLIKTVLWGWCGDISKRLGGAVYLSNEVPDVGVANMKKCCEKLTSDFSSIQKGELLFISGHVGVYVGDGKCVEATLNSSKSRNGVILSFVENLKSDFANSEKLYSRRWDSHGKLSFIDYSDASGICSLSLPILQKGDKGNCVFALQALLSSRNFMGRNANKLSLDSSFGADTRFALCAFQKSVGLKEDGVCGSSTWEALLK